MLLDVDDMETAAACLIAGFCCCCWKRASTEMLLHADNACLLLDYFFLSSARLIISLTNIIREVSSFGGLEQPARLIDFSAMHTSLGR